ncbi:uncharacterized protein C11orf52 homolog isoform X2 [Octodon degus]|uniref:Uncharacterized protein C11orf52 homolog isoform X2 n=1 Tax=Octodon degus TaxID=10160 RepID=A0A6P6DQV3_OCTDE|nr:uncharacterized protein C11orf52 homolog isoform X2 [Octodon degus]
MHKVLYVEKQLGSLGERAPWETGCAAGQAGAAHHLSRTETKQGHKLTGHMYEQGLQKPAFPKRSQDLASEESNLHYADIQVYSRAQPRSASEVKHLQLESATEYATLYFPQATPCYDSKNGTLV